MGDALWGAHVHNVEDTTVDQPCAKTGRRLAAETLKRETSHLRTQIARWDLTATSVKANAKARTTALKLKNSTRLKRRFSVKQ